MYICTYGTKWNRSSVRKIWVMCIPPSLSLSGVLFINFWAERRSVLFGLMNILESHEALMASCSVMAFSCIFHDYPHRQRLHLHRCTFTCYKHSAFTFLSATRGVKCWVYVWCVVYSTCQQLVAGLEFDWPEECWYTNLWLSTCVVSVRS